MTKLLQRGGQGWGSKHMMLGHPRRSSGRKPLPPESQWWGGGGVTWTQWEWGEWKKRYPSAAVGTVLEQRGSRKEIPWPCSPLPTNILLAPHRDQLETGKGPQETILQGLPAGAQNTVEKVREWIDLSSTFRNSGGNLFLVEVFRYWLYN